MGESIVTSVGDEIAGIVYPVSICMMLVVVLVRCLPNDSSNSMMNSIAILVFNENSSDSDWHKFLGAVLNSLVFVGVVTLVTFLLVLLFYFRCTKFLRIYMGIAAFIVFVYMGGGVSVLLIQELAIPFDAITYAIVLYNFAIVGVFSVFFCKMPILFTQGYLIIIGMLVAFWFTMLPEWTTWALLVAMALYDIAAVLTPGGPLKILVELAVTRDEEIPALIYEARPAIPQNSMLCEPNSSQIPQLSQSHPPESHIAVTPGQQRRWKRRSSHASSGSSSLIKWLNSVFSKDTDYCAIPMATEEHQGGLSMPSGDSLRAYSRDGSKHPGQTMADQGSVVGRTTTSSASSDEGVNGIIFQIGSASTASEEESQITSESQITETLQSGDSNEDYEQVPSINKFTSSIHNVAHTRNGTEPASIEAESHQSLLRSGDEMDEGMGLGASGAIKLGLGDFIFYSVLVGRAAMYDLMAVYACYLAIIAGLGATLLLLALYRHALPALPISVSLGVMFYFLTRLLMEYFMVQCSTHLTFF
eukprot:c25492_g1_i2 orf=756-2345(+)